MRRTSDLFHKFFGPLENVTFLCGFQVFSVASPSVSSNNPNHVTVTASPSPRLTDSKLELARSTFPSAVINFKNWYLRKVGEISKRQLSGGAWRKSGSQVSLVTGWARVFVGGVQKHTLVVPENPNFQQDIHRRINPGRFFRQLC